MIFDTHLHVIDRAALHYPWLADVAALNHDFSYESYALEARRVGIAGCLHMEVDVAEGDIDAETTYVRGLAARPGSLVRGAISACRPEGAGFAAWLEQARAGGFVKGLRRVLHVMPDELSDAPLFRENLRRLAGTGLTFDLVVMPHQLPRAAALADLVPDVTFILDHCGVPDIKGGGLEPWRAQMSEIARRPNVVGKISGVVAYADRDGWSLEDIRPYVEHTAECFGFDRLVWGSDWPVCTQGGGLSTWVAATQALFAGASTEERRKLFWQNARRIWDLAE